jgi:hypothetical protein
MPFNRFPFIDLALRHAGHSDAQEDSPKPRWGIAFRQMDRDKPVRALLRARHLVDHVEMMQRGEHTISTGEGD